MRKIKEKRAMEMAANTLVAIVLAVVLLVLLLAILTNGFQGFRDKISNYLASSNVDNVISVCNNLVSLNDKYEYCCSNKTIKLSAKERFEMPCIKAANQTWGKSIENLNCEEIC